MAFLKDLFGMSHSEKAHEQLYGNEDYMNGQQQPHHKSSFTHELVAGAAGFAAMKAYEDHVRRTGEHVSHPLMKEMLAGFAAAEVDKLFETKGLDFLDREKAKRHAVQQAHHLAHEQYGPGGTYNWQGDPYGSGAGAYPPQGNQYGPGFTPYPQQGNQYGPGAGFYQQQGNQYGPGFSPYPQPGGQYGPGGGPYPQQGGYGNGGYQQPPPYGGYSAEQGEHHRHHHYHHNKD